MPIGIVRNGVDNSRVFIDYAPLHELKDNKGILMFRHSISDYTALPDGWKLHRQLLASQPDHSVSICSLGFVTCLAELLESVADEYSPLNGVELVRQKVKRLYLVGGNFHTPPVAEYNIEASFEFANVFFNLWPKDVDILFSPAEVGDELYYTGAIIIDDISWTDVHPIATGNCRYQLRGTASWNTRMLEKIRTVTK